MLTNEERQKKNVNPYKGACKYCYEPLRGKVGACPLCGEHDPYQLVEDAIQALLKRGYLLYATELLTRTRDMSIVEAREHCEALNVAEESSLARPIDDLIESLVTNENPGDYMNAVRLARNSCRFWGLKEIKEYLDTKYQDVLPTLSLDKPVRVGVMDNKGHISLIKIVKK